MHERLNKFKIYTDEQLMHFIINGDEAAFSELYHRYAKNLLNYFTRMLNFNKTLAEDALQDLFLKIAESPEKFDHSRSFKTWIFTIASNQCKNFYRHQNIIQQKKDEIIYEYTDLNESEFAMHASKLDADRLNHIITTNLNELPLEKKEAFILKYQEDKTLEEISIIQECSIGTVKSRIHYTIKILEDKLKEYNPNFH